MPRHREKPVHPLVQRIWDLQQVEGPKEAADKTGVDLNVISLSADVERMDNFIGKVEQWARKMGLKPQEFSKLLDEYIQDKYRSPV